MKRIKTSLLNCVSSDSNLNQIESYPVASVINSCFISLIQSIPSCISCLGGPAVLFPILQAAHTEIQIIQFFSILSVSIKNNSNNRKYMYVTGYSIVGFLLSIKPQHLLTTNIIDVIFDICISRSCNTGSSSSILTPSSSILLCDSKVFNIFI